MRGVVKYAKEHFLYIDCQTVKPDPYIKAELAEEGGTTKGIEHAFP
jgi:hypothetical protein